MIEILLIDQQEVTAHGMKQLLEDAGYLVVHTPFTESNMVDIIHPGQTGVIIIDGPVAEMAAICSFLKRESLSIPLISFTNLTQPSELIAIFRAGIGSHISKRARVEEIIAGLESVFRNEAYLCTYTRGLLPEAPAETIAGYPPLSDREKEIILLIAEGRSDKDIAGSLFISYHTVRTHRKNLSKKLGFSLKNAAELILLVRTLGNS